MGNFTKAFLATTLALSSTLVFAEGEMKDQTIDPTVDSQITPTFENLDVNRDGAIAKSEVPADHELNTLFASLDTNSDQQLSRAEFSSYTSGDDEEEAE